MKIFLLYLVIYQKIDLQIILLIVHDGIICQIWQFCMYLLSWKLQCSSASNNLFGGIIPTVNSTNLKVLYVQVFKLTYCRELSGNKFTQFDPNLASSFMSLEILDLSSNNLVGDIPHICDGSPYLQNLCVYNFVVNILALFPIIVMLVEH